LLIPYTGVFCASGRPILLLPDASSGIPLPYGRYSLVIRKYAATATATRPTAATAAPHVSTTASATATKHMETTGGRPNERAVRGRTAGSGLRWGRLYFYLVTTWFRSRRHIVPKKVRTHSVIVTHILKMFCFVIRT